jgi:hypothetical protein
VGRDAVSVPEKEERGKKMISMGTFNKQRLERRRANRGQVISHCLK